MAPIGEQKAWIVRDGPAIDSWFHEFREITEQREPDGPNDKRFDIGQPRQFRTLRDSG